MPSRPIAEYYGHLGPTDTYSLDSSWHGKTPLDSSVQNAIGPSISMPTTIGTSHVLENQGSIRFNGDGIIPPTINHVVAIHPLTKRTVTTAGGDGGESESSGTTGPRWE